MGKKVIVDILGRKAQIKSVCGRLAEEPWWRKDRIQVGLSFDEPVEGFVELAINLPVRGYTQAEFLEAVRQEGEKRLEMLVESVRLRRDEQKLQKEKMDALNRGVDKIKSLIGLD